MSQNICSLLHLVVARCLSCDMREYSCLLTCLHALEDSCLDGLRQVNGSNWIFTLTVESRYCKVLRTNCLVFAGRIISLCTDMKEFASLIGCKEVYERSSSRMLESDGPCMCARAFAGLGTHALCA